MQKFKKKKSDSTEDRNALIVVTGGARSGKSTFAENLLAWCAARRGLGEKIAYIATGVPCDEEFRLRIEKHKKQRSELFHTYEETLAIDAAVRKASKKYRLILVECLTTWLGNVFFNYTDESEAEKFITHTLDSLLRDCFSVPSGDISISQRYNSLSISGAQLMENQINGLAAGIHENRLSLPSGIIADPEKCRSIVIFIANETGLGIVPDNRIARLFRDWQGIVNRRMTAAASYAYLCMSGIPIRLK